MTAIGIKQGPNVVPEQIENTGVSQQALNVPLSPPVESVGPLPNKFVGTSFHKPSLFGSIKFGDDFFKEVAPGQNLAVDLGDAENHPAFESGCPFTAENKAFLYACLEQRS